VTCTGYGTVTTGSGSLFAAALKYGIGEFAPSFAFFALLSGGAQLYLCCIKLKTE